MRIKILDPNLNITFHGEHKLEFSAGEYEVDKETGEKLIRANFAIAIAESENKTHESENV